MNKKQYDCRMCLNQKTIICEGCESTQFPSGNMSKPTKYYEFEDLINDLKKCEDNAIKRAKSISIIMECFLSNIQIPSSVIDEYNKTINN